MSLPVTRRRSSLALLSTLLTGGLLGGCGATHQVPSGGTLDVSVNEWRVTPQNVDARAGSMLIVVHNSGRLAHDLVLSHDGVRVTATPPIMPGQNADMSASIGKGSYLIYSSMLDDQATGVYGTLHVG
jgi:hypothetical protein